MTAAVDVDVALGRLEQLDDERCRIDARLEAIEDEDALLQVRVDELEHRRAELEREQLSLDEERVDLEGEADRLEDERRGLVDARDRADEEYTELYAELDRFADSEGPARPDPSEAANAVPEPVVAANTEIGDLFGDQSFTVPDLPSLPPAAASAGALDYAAHPGASGASRLHDTTWVQQPRPQPPASLWRRHWKVLAGAGGALLTALVLAFSLAGADTDDATAPTTPAPAAIAAPTTPPSAAPTAPPTEEQAAPEEPRKASARRGKKRRGKGKRKNKRKRGTKRTNGKKRQRNDDKRR